MSDETQKPDQPPFDEPSVLDYVKSLFRFRQGEKIEFPSFVEEEILVEPGIEEDQIIAPEQEQLPITNYQPRAPFPWRSLLAFLCALIGQKLFEPPANSTPLGYALYVGAFSALGWAIYRGEWTLAPYKATAEKTDPLTYNCLALFISIPLGFWAFAILRDNLFTKQNIVVWCLALIFLVWAFWIRQKNPISIFENITSFFQRDRWTISISRWALLLFAATALVFFFRFYRTADVPPEPFSDHAEKILDVYDVTQGQTHIFFTRNTGREGFQMYWTVLINWVFHTGLSFLSLKLGTALLGFLTLPFIYLLGKEIGGPRVGLFAFILTGIGYWPNVISRVGLRFPLYPLFAAPTLLYLMRGLRTRNRNDFILSGLFLGLGLHGYSPIRIVPIVVVVAFLLYWLHAQSKGARKELPIWLFILALTSVFVFLPLLRYWFDEPAVFSFRAMTRLTGEESPITRPVSQIFLSNVWNALKMFNFDDGEIWVHSVTHRPALDVISAALFSLGLALVFVRYLRQHHWLDLFLLVSIPLLQLPSTLSLAFPGENPALNRAGGAYIPVFLLGAMALDGLVSAIGLVKRRAIFVWGMSAILLYFSASQNFDLVFNQYYTAFRQASWNTSDMGKVVKQFQQTYGRTDTVWVVPYPYWVDTRLPAVWAGIPNRDMAMWRDDLAGTVELTGPKLFIVKADTEDPAANDQDSLNVLDSLYPNGQLRLFKSDVPGHDFWIFFVPSK